MAGGILLLLSVPGLFVGIFMWADVFQVGGDVGRLMGFVIFFLSFAALVGVCLTVRAQKRVVGVENKWVKGAIVALTAVGSAFISVAVFGFFVYLHLIPLFPYTEATDTAFGAIFITFFVLGSSSFVAELLMILHIRPRP